MNFQHEGDSVSPAETASFRSVFCNSSERAGRPGNVHAERAQIRQVARGGESRAADCAEQLLHSRHCLNVEKKNYVSDNGSGPEVDVLRGFHSTEARQEISRLLPFLCLRSVFPHGMFELIFSSN